MEIVDVNVSVGKGAPANRRKSADNAAAVCLFVSESNYSPSVVRTGVVQTSVWLDIQVTKRAH